MVFAEAPLSRATWAFPPGPERLKPFEPENFNSAKLKLTGPVSLTRILSPPAPTCNARRSVRLSPLDRSGREVLESSASALSFASPWSVPWEASPASPSASKRSSTSVPAGLVGCGAPTSPSGIVKSMRYSSRQRQRKDGGQSFAEIETSAAASWMTPSLRKESETTSAFELDCVSASTTQASSASAMKAEEAAKPEAACQSTEAKREEAHSTKQSDATSLAIEAPPKDQPVAHMWFSLDDLEAKIKEFHQAKEEPQSMLMIDAEEVQSADSADEGVPLDAEVPTRVRPGEFLLWEPDEDVDIAAEDVACCTAGNAVEVGLRDFLAEAWLDSEFNTCFVEEEEV
mmetsp:Transcript_62092/g.108680  ORF Transcript_62092/g.108680 Transcript_62092/m.108680 type:complete len:344 (-) Transcript_62092:60-1091(-)